jgi:hypothetical protein
VPFAYYTQLSPEERLVYRASDLLTSLPLRGARELAPDVAAIEAALARSSRSGVERAARRLVRALSAAFGTRPPRVEVLEVRPTFTGGELHGLYTLERNGRARIQVWMRTARFGRVVAFRTFLRTVLHELLHHLDFHLLRLPASFHTEGFFKRESSLFRQLVPRAPARRSSAAAASARRLTSTAVAAPRRDA